MSAGSISIERLRDYLARGFLPKDACAHVYDTDGGHLGTLIDPRRLPDSYVADYAGVDPEAAHEALRGGPPHGPLLVDDWACSGRALLYLPLAAYRKLLALASFLLETAPE